jgi:hypothetical protein
VGVIDQVRVQVLGVINMLMRDDTIKRSITYCKALGTQTWDDVKGAAIEQYDEVPVDVLELRHTENSIKAIGSSEIQVGDIVYVAKWNDLPEGVSLKDYLIVDDVVKKIKVLNPAIETVTFITVAGN